MRREYDSDERFTGLEHTRILTHISSVRHVCQRAPTHYFVELGILQYSYSNTLRVQEYTTASGNGCISFRNFSLHILEHESVSCII